MIIPILGMALILALVGHQTWMDRKAYLGSVGKEGRRKMNDRDQNAESEAQAQQAYQEEMRRQSESRRASHSDSKSDKKVTAEMFASWLCAYVEVKSIDIKERMDNSKANKGKRVKETEKV